MTTPPAEAAALVTRTASRDLAVVDAETISAEIAAVSREVSAARQGDGPHPARTYLMNLVVHAWDQESARLASEAIERISGLYPSRSLIIEAHREASEDSLRATISAVCEPDSEGADMVCLEEVRIAASGTASDHLMSLIEPLLVPDLPVFLLWLGTPPDSNEELLALCDRLLVDSSSFPEMLPQLGRLVQLLSVEKPEGGKLATSDFSWTRLMPWREMVAQFFDSPESLQHLSRLSNVRVEYATEPGRGVDAAQPLLLVSWLAGRLGWEPANVLSRASSREYRLEFYREREIVTAQIVPRARKGEGIRHGEILGVALQAGGKGNGREATFSVSREPDGVHAVALTRFAGVREIHRTVPLETLCLDDLLKQELRVVARDRIFEESLSLAGRLLA